MGRCLKKHIKQLNRVSIWVSLGLGLVLGLVPSTSTVLSSISAFFTWHRILTGKIGTDMLQCNAKTCTCCQFLKITRMPKQGPKIRMCLGKAGHMIIWLNKILTDGTCTSQDYTFLCLSSSIALKEEMLSPKIWLPNETLRMLKSFLFENRLSVSKKNDFFDYVLDWIVWQQISNDIIGSGIREHCHLTALHTHIAQRVQ